MSDSRKLKLKKCLENSVNLKWSTVEAQPGEQASLTVDAEPKSLCSIGK